MSDQVSRRVSEHRAREDGRGRDAKKVTEIPAKGWKDIVLRVKDEISDDRVGSIAAGTTFYILLALFPGLAALVSLYGLVADPSAIQRHVDGMAGFLPESMISLIDEELVRLTSQQTGTLSLAFVVSLLFALWSANNGIRALFDAMNVAYDEKEKRGFFTLLATTLTFTIGSILFLALLTVVVAGVPVVIAFLGLGALGQVLLTVLPALVLLLVASLGIAALYRYGPSRERAEWHWITPGSVVTAIVWLIGSALFSWYLSNWGNYSATYGSLGTVVAAMMWIYVSVYILLVGAELNSEIEHQTAHDTTTGPEKPLGERGATMADRVGEARA